MQKHSETQTHWGKHSPLATPTQTETEKPTAQETRGIQTVVTTPPPRHLHQATHPNASQAPPKATLIPSPQPGKHSAPAKPPGMHWALLASSLVLPTPHHSVKATCSVRVNRTRTRNQSRCWARCWAQESARRSPPGSARRPHTLPRLVRGLTQLAHSTCPPTQWRQATATRRTTTPPLIPRAPNATWSDGKSDFRTHWARDTDVSLGVLGGLRTTNGQTHQNFDATFGSVATRPGSPEHFHPRFDDGCPRSRRRVGG